MSDTMNHEREPDRKTWTKPEIKRLGKLRDVAGPGGPGVQGSRIRLPGGVS